MRFSNIISIVAALSAVPASADDTQLARSAGVSSGQYSVGELAALIHSNEERDHIRADRIVSRSRVNVFPWEGAPATLALRARSSESGPIAYVRSVAEDTEDHGAIQRGAVAVFEAKLAGTHVPRPASHVSAGEAQIAAVLGVDPADYTLAELVSMKAAAFDQDRDD